ncbi:MAG TPA: VWA domain-containing protein, partial [Fibrella sp.]
MFLPFFLLLRQNALPVTLPEYLTLLDGLRSDVGGVTVDDFYYLSKTALVKHEQHLDLFDRLFGQWVSDASTLGTLPATSQNLPDVPPDWLRDALALNLSEEEKAAL